jgi:hypothetical protein
MHAVIADVHMYINYSKSIPVAALYKSIFCCRLHRRIAVSNPVGIVDVSLVIVACCRVEFL